MRIIAIAAFALSFFQMAANAQSFDWGEVNLPLRSGDWQSMPEAGKTGYSIGATQVAAFLSGEDRNESGCIAGLYELFVEEADDQTSDDPMLFIVDQIIEEQCSTSPKLTSDVLSSLDIAYIFDGDGEDGTWTGFVLGLSDYLHFRVYANFGETEADCVKGKALRLVLEDAADAAEWTDMPTDPFVKGVMLSALNECGVG